MSTCFSANPAWSDAMKTLDIAGSDDMSHQGLRISHLVIVPGEHLHERTVDHARQRKVSDGSVGLADDVARDELVIGRPEDTLPARLRGGGAQELVHLLPRGWSLRDESNVRNRPRHHRHW